MNERELLVDCLRRLNRTGVTYYLTGSMASNYWGIPRTTHDLDFVVQLPTSAVPRIMPLRVRGGQGTARIHHSPFAGLKASNVTAWAGASTASGGPGNVSQIIPQGLKGRNNLPIAHGVTCSALTGRKGIVGYR